VRDPDLQSPSSRALLIGLKLVTMDQEPRFLLSKLTIHTDKRPFTCRYGCQTSSGIERGFMNKKMNKKTFLEHIVLEHPRVRIVLETPPNEERRTEGTRHIMTALNEHGK
jgi:hypothetical protein